jgi:hypothetical protein
MAERPIFIPKPESRALVAEVFLPLTWNSGFALVQKEKKHQGAARSSLGCWHPQHFGSLIEYPKSTDETPSPGSRANLQSILKAFFLVPVKSGGLNRSMQHHLI